MFLVGEGGWGEVGKEEEAVGVSRGLDGGWGKGGGFGGQRGLDGEGVVREDEVLFCGAVLG